MRRSAATSIVASLSIAIGGLNIANAAESGTGAYILGLRGPGAGMTPPPGVFLSNQVYIYSGDIEGRIPFEDGQIVGAGDVDIIVDIPTVLWVTPAEIAGGRLAFSLTVPFGHVDIDGTLGPLVLSDETTTFADPSVGAFVGWRHDNLHWQLGVTGFLPIGDYDDDELANVAKHRLALDVFGTFTWLVPEWGLDISNIVGVTFNWENEETDYETGTEFHWEWAVTKKFENGFSLGPAGYYYKQLSGDEGPGAILGDFKGETVSIGGVLGYDFTVGRLPVSTRVRYYHELESTNRLEGDAVFVSLSMPLWVQGQ